MNSCLRGFIVGLASLIGGALITRFHGNYRVAFIFGIIGTTIGFSCLTADKAMVPLQGLGHDWSAEFDRRAWRWLDERLKR
jgi:hypothetical protein